MRADPSNHEWDATSAIRAAVDDTDESPSQCWCCGTTEDPSRMVHLGNHPEVALCIRCARSVSKWAWEIEDRSMTGPLVTARNWFRAVRRDVVRRGWQNNPVFGGPIRWIGKRLP